MDSAVLEEMERYLALPLNASSVHRHGQKARALLEECREELASFLNLNPGDVVFTSGASESNNLAIRGLHAAHRRLGLGAFHVLTSPLEHSSIKKTLEVLSTQETVRVSRMDVTPSGRVVLPDTLSQRLHLLCLIAVQNETGVIQPVEHARRLRGETGTLWLCDITQAIGTEYLDIKNLGADLVSFSSHKVYGPPGAGALAGPGVRRLAPQITGGSQEGEMRAGTQPVALIRGFVTAVRLATEQAKARTAHLEELRTLFLETLDAAETPYAINGGEAPRHPGFLSLSFPGFAGADLVIALDARGISVSSGSACATGVMETSEVLAAMYPGEKARAAGALRITAGKETSPEEMRRAASALAKIVNELPRSISP